MMTINANTKIGAILKEHPGALDAIVSISPKFSKLRNPILRRVIAGRTSIATASKMGNCTVDEFFDKLGPLGFAIDKNAKVIDTCDEMNPVPDFLRDLDADKITNLDVRPVLEAGKDPLKLIMNAINELEPGHVLKIVNSFEPTPLITLLGKRGFESYAERINNELVNTYFYETTGKAPAPIEINTNDNDGWDEVLERYAGKLVTIDVRELEMPFPMHRILESLSSLPPGRALFVYHKRIPVFLLPELEEQKFSYRIKEISDAEVHLLIYKD